MSNPTSEFKLFSGTTLMGFGLGGAGMATIVSIAGKVAPINKRSLAMGLVAAAGSFGQFAVVVPTMWMNKHYGWQFSLIVLSSITISLLFLLPLLNNTEQISDKTQQFNDGLKTLSFSMAERNYILLVMGFLFVDFM